MRDFYYAARNRHSLNIVRAALLSEALNDLKDSDVVVFPEQILNSLEIFLTSEGSFRNRIITYYNNKFHTRFSSHQDHGQDINVEEGPSPDEPMSSSIAEGLQEGLTPDAPMNSSIEEQLQGTSSGRDVPECVFEPQSGTESATISTFDIPGGAEQSSVPSVSSAVMSSETPTAVETGQMPTSIPKPRFGGGIGFQALPPNFQGHSQDVKYFQKLQK